MVDSVESLLKPLNERQEKAQAHTHDTTALPSPAESVKYSDGVTPDPSAFLLAGERGTGGGAYRPRRRDAQGRALKSRTTVAQLKSVYRWYADNQLRRASFPMPCLLWDHLHEHAKQTKQTFWRMASRMLQEALDRERTTPVDAAQNVEELLR